MSTSQKSQALILGLCLFFGLTGLGYLLADAAITYKEYERSVKVKGLAEQEFKADIVIWPITFTLANNDLQPLYNDLEKNTQIISQFLIQHGIKQADISVAIPSINDKLAQQYGNQQARFRYVGNQTLTVYSNDIDEVRSVMNKISELGQQGIVISGNEYNASPQYLFTRLNEIKPKMIEEATRNARDVAEKFAADSQSQLGKIKKAYQGQFSISARDQNNPHIKKVRVVSTIEYYLSD